MVGRFRNTFRGYRRSWSCLKHLVRVQSPTHCDQYDQLWRIRGVGIPRKPSAQQKAAHNLGVVFPWFKEQWDRVQHCVSKLQFSWVPVAAAGPPFLVMEKVHTAPWRRPPSLWPQLPAP